MELKIDLEDRVRKLYKKAERDVTRTYERIDWLKGEIIKYAPYDPITAKIKRGIAAADARLIAYIGWKNEFYHLVDEIDDVSSLIGLGRGIHRNGRRSKRRI